MVGESLLLSMMICEKSLKNPMLRKKKNSGDPHRAPKEQEEIKNKDIQSKFHQKRRRRRAKNFHLVQERHLSIKLPAVQLNLLPSSISSVMDGLKLLDNAKFYSLASSATKIFSCAKGLDRSSGPKPFSAHLWEQLIGVVELYHWEKIVLTTRLLR